MQRKRAETDKQQWPPPHPPKIKLFFYFCSYLACERILSSDFVCRRLQGIFPLTRISDQDAFKLYNSVSVPSIISTDFSDFPWCFIFVNTLEGWSARGSPRYSFKAISHMEPRWFSGQSFQKTFVPSFISNKFFTLSHWPCEGVNVDRAFNTPKAQSPPVTLNKTAHAGKKGNLQGRSSSPGREEGYGGFWLWR